MASGLPWQGAQDDVAAASYFNFLTECDALAPDFLDSQTLAAVCTTDPAYTVPKADDATRKRLAADDSDSDDAGRESKKGKADPQKDAARSKACREKARREKINERFAELARLIDPSSEPKSDKPSILADAIKHVQQLRVENHQLKQLNKFLEERVAQNERDRGQHLYHQSLMMQHAAMLPGMLPHGLPGGLSGMQGAGTSSAGPSSMAGPSGINATAAAMAAAAAAAASAPPMPHHLLPLQAAAAAAAAAAAQQAASTSGAAPNPAASTPPMLPPTATPPMPLGGAAAIEMYAAAMAAAMASHPGSSSTPAPPQLNPALSGVTDPTTSGRTADMAAAGAVQPAAAAGAAGTGGKGLLMGHPLLGGAPGAGIPQQPWLNPNMLDSQKDSLLRPPAA